MLHRQSIFRPMNGQTDTDEQTNPSHTPKPNNSIRECTQEYIKT